MEIIKNLSIIELEELKDQVIGELLRKLSDARCNPRINEVLEKLFSYFPDCNGFVLCAAYRDDQDKRWVFGFEEIEESCHEGSLGYFSDEQLKTINSVISTGEPLDPQVEDLLQDLFDIYPHPIEEEYDWDVIERGEKIETLVLKTLEYV